MRGRLAGLAVVVLVATVDLLVRAAAGHSAAAPAADALPGFAAPPPAAATPSAAGSARPKPRTQVHVTTPVAGHDMHGVVVDGSGRRLAGVHVAYDESLPDAPGFRPVAVTDAAGRFAVPCETRSVAPATPPLLLSSYDAATGLVDPAAPDIAWVEIAQECGSPSSPGVRVTASGGAALTGTLYQHSAPATRAGLRVGVECDGMPRGNVDAFRAQVLAAVSTRDGTFRLTGLRSDRCAVGVFDRAGGAGREIVRQVDVTAGRTTRLDVRDDGQDHFRGPSAPPSPTPSPSPTGTCLAVCPRIDVPDRP